MRVLLARHGQTDWNAAAKIQGASDVPLNARGREQARSLAERVRRERVGAIYSSPLSRARETAEIIGKTLGVNVITAPELTELSFGDWEGCTWEEIGERFPGALEAEGLVEPEESGEDAADEPELEDMGGDTGGEEDFVEVTEQYLGEEDGKSAENGPEQKN